MEANNSYHRLDSRKELEPGRNVGFLFDIDGVFLQTKQSSRGIFVDMIRDFLDCPFTREQTDSCLKDFFHSYASQGEIAYLEFFNILERNDVNTSSFETAEWFAKHHEIRYLDAIDQDGVVETIPDGIELLRCTLNWNINRVAAVTGHKLKLRNSMCPN